MKDKTEARIAMMRKLLEGREMMASEIVRAANFPNVRAFLVWLDGQCVSRELPIYETDDHPRRYGLLDSGGKR